MSRPKGGLGRGLDALIPQTSSTFDNLVHIDQIIANPYQPRGSMDEGRLQSLVESIKQNGILQPLLVQRQGDHYQLIAGHRRLHAAKMAGVQQVPVVIREARASDNMLLLALIENLQREDLNPIDEAKAYRELQRKFGFSTDEIAERVGKSRPAVANALRLLELAPEVKEMLIQGQISEGHARALLGLRDPQSQINTARLVVERGLSVRQTEQLVKRLRDNSGQRSSQAIDPEVTYLEERFRQALGTKVSLSRSRRGGKLVIHFYSEEELQSIYEVIVGDRSR
ncbi:parB-like partition protein [Thermobaculum terrenum ATCC BAA-798]|uniref:ParB-like partition protein n=1 Tax=Thermobaculum terrenum (strain ATCC BAA-798 / CCMEE 7001 / YNP1) TaxID=525904 RepID=D1CER6_THET1|nr:ParB/RepB/Spo0J family partition protein [Thermobaculum terrenum]ACZ41422.1 parB-like partition protein [Thermobaculum terrenum ATCC BAA-798]